MRALRTATERRGEPSLLSVRVVSPSSISWKSICIDFTASLPYNDVLMPFDLSQDSSWAQDVP